MDQGGDTHQERARQVDEQRRGVLPTFPNLRNLFAPKLSGEQRLDTVSRKASVEAEMSTININ